ncbi:MAG: ABC transporter ATP-binding protein [Bacteroidota bacterium]
MEPIVSIQQLDKSYGSTDVLTNLDLDIPQGEIFGLIGPNGAGKTTLLGILTGILPFDGGSISVAGLPWDGEHETEIKQQMASVMQPPLLFDHFTCYDYLDYVCEMYGVNKMERADKIDSLMTYFELDPFLSNKTQHLSSGNRKKLAFIAAILTDPQILFLDEPFESVDVISIRRMKNLMHRLKENGVTIFITSHILEIVENLCDDIAILHEGNIIAYLDSASRAELEQQSSLAEIFEQYVAVDEQDEELLSWI